MKQYAVKTGKENQVADVFIETKDELEMWWDRYPWLFRFLS